MYKRFILFWIGTFITQCSSGEPFRPKHGSMPFVVYFPSRYRGLCVGSLVSRTAVITALVCVVNPLADVRDTRPINVVTGTAYRHSRRGIRVQVSKILLPNIRHLPLSDRGYIMSKSCAILLLKRKVPDILVEIPLRPIPVDYKGDEGLNMHDECLMPGWHFFYKGDKSLAPNRFLLQRHLRVQYLSIVKKSIWCEALAIKLQKSLVNMGFTGHFDKTACICVRDGMYGAPLICKGKAVGMLMAPDGQWSNCTGFSNLIHIFANKYHRKFLDCVSSLFVVDKVVDWATMQNAILSQDSEEYDPIPEMYGPIDSKQDTSEELYTK